MSDLDQMIEDAKAVLEKLISVRDAQPAEPVPGAAEAASAVAGAAAGPSVAVPNDVASSIVAAAADPGQVVAPAPVPPPAPEPPVAAPAAPEPPADPAAGKTYDDVVAELLDALRLEATPDQLGKVHNFAVQVLKLASQLPPGA